MTPEQIADLAEHVMHLDKQVEVEIELLSLYYQGKSDGVKDLSNKLTENKNGN